MAGRLRTRLEMRLDKYMGYLCRTVAFSYLTQNLTFPWMWDDCNFFSSLTTIPSDMKSFGHDKSWLLFWTRQIVIPSWIRWSLNFKIISYSIKNSSSFHNDSMHASMLFVLQVIGWQWALISYLSVAIIFKNKEDDLESTKL